MFDPLKHRYTPVWVTSFLVLGGFFFSSPRAWAQG